MCFKQKSTQTPRSDGCDIFRANPIRCAVRDVPQGRFGNIYFKGNRTLLTGAIPRKMLQISGRATHSKIVRTLKALKRFDGVVYSSFVSPGEQACLDALLAAQARVVWIVPKGLPASIPAAWMDAFLDGRALWVSSFAEGVLHTSRSGFEQADSIAKALCRDGETVL